MCSEQQMINIPLDAYFHSDPTEELAAARQRSVVICANLFKNAEILTRHDVAKAEVQRIWENLRQEFVASKRTYEEQLQAEQQGYADALRQKIEEFELKIGAGIAPDFWDKLQTAIPFTHCVSYKPLRAALPSHSRTIFSPSQSFATRSPNQRGCGFAKKDEL
jgi:hypothetical protein